MGCFRAVTSIPAPFKAVSTPFRIARLEMVTPVTVSTARDWASTTRSGIRRTGQSTRPGVSTFSVTFTFSMRSSVTVTSTVMGPCIPETVAV